MGRPQKSEEKLPDVVIQAIDVINNTAGWSCTECEMKLGPNERCVDVVLDRHVLGVIGAASRGKPERPLFCLPCASVFLKGTDQVLVHQIKAVQDRIAKIRDIQKMVGRETKRRGHIFVGRKLAGG